MGRQSIYEEIADGLVRVVLLPLAILIIIAPGLVYAKIKRIFKGK